MSDIPPPTEPPSADPVEPAAATGWAALPRWVKIGIPVVGVLLIALIGVLVWQADDAAAIDDALEELADEKETVPTTIPPPITTTTVAETTTTAATTTAAPTTTEATTTTVTVATTTTAVATTTTVAATTTAATTTTAASTTTTVEDTTTTEEATTTTEEETTTTEEETTTTEEETTTTEEETTTTSAPPAIPVPPGSVAANAREFANAWNANAAGTDVPQLSEDSVTALDDGPSATTFIAKLSDRVGLVGVVRNDDRSLAEVLLAWIPGGDEEESNQLYRDAFDVLVRTVNPDLSDDDRAQLAQTLGLSPSSPAFAAGTNLSTDVPPDRYTAFVRPTRVSDDTDVISVVNAEPR